MATSDESHRWQRQQIEAAIREIQKLGPAYRNSASKQKRYAMAFGLVDVGLGGAAAVLAALAGASTFGDLFGRTVTGVIALLAAALSALIAVVKATDRGTAAWKKYDNFKTLGDQVSEYVTVGVLDPTRKLDAPDLYADFLERRAVARRGSPLPDMWSHGRPSHAMSDDMSWLMD